MQPHYAFEEIREKVQQLLGKKITQFSLFGKGAVNNAYLIETIDGEKYIVKQEKEVKEFQPQNTLLVEASVARALEKAQLTIPVPNVAFTSEDPMMYGYPYIEGDLMIRTWESLDEKERINICHALGVFHAEIGKKISKESAAKMGVAINDSTDLHPETIEEYNSILKSDDVPDEWKALARHAKDVFDNTSDKTVFQFIHNDSHHENIIIRDKKIVGIIDFGNAEYGEVAKEFSRYIRDYPDYFQFIVFAYEEASGIRLSYKRLVNNAFLSGLIDMVENYRKGDDARVKSEKAFVTYRRLLN
jgi:aminoglycoside phosphotransferase (APT) family kinase protein